MRYLKSFNESFNKEYIDNIKDILLELEDDGYITIITKGKFDWISENRIDFIYISNQLKPFEFSDIKDSMLRLKRFLGEDWISCSVLFSNSNSADNIDVDINEEDYDNLDQWFGCDKNKSTGILNIYIFFNK